MVAVLALAALTAVTSTFAMTRIAIERGAERYIAVGYENGVSALRESLAQRITAGQLDPRALPSPIPAMTPIPPTAACASTTSPCPYRVSESFTFDPSTSAENNLESDAHVNEARISAHVTVSVLAPDSTVLVSRSKSVTLRITSVPPYVTPAGTRDATSLTPTLGDDGGLPPPTPSSACASAAPGGDETVVRAQYYNDANGKCYDGSAWHSAPAARTSTTGW
ncbi:MAG: hypothetical protein JO165_10515 [Candidatus Eremiobacteraeota bacterium]|nr:hypothetical protein [Candidatus Eremiobacteraeota bacterium]